MAPSCWHKPFTGSEYLFCDGFDQVEFYLEKIHVAIKTICFKRLIMTKKGQVVIYLPLNQAG